MPRQSSMIFLHLCAAGQIRAAPHRAVEVLPRRIGVVTRRPLQPRAAVHLGAASREFLPPATAMCTL
jgi:hypothetical protein